METAHMESKMKQPTKITIQTVRIQIIIRMIRGVALIKTNLTEIQNKIK